MDLIDWDTSEEIPQLKTKIRNNLTLCFMKKGDWEKCVEWAKASLEFDKNNFKGYLRMAHAFVEMKDSCRASEILDKLETFRNGDTISDVANLKKAVLELKSTEQKVHQEIQERTGQKLAQGISHCNCNCCILANFENRILRYIKRDKLVLAQYEKALENFEDSLKKARAADTREN